MPTQGVIVYLVQTRHSSYADRDSLKLLRRSVFLLHDHYNRKHRDDILFFSEHGGVTPADQQSVLSLCGEASAHFVELDPRHFRLPDDVDPSSPRWLFKRKYSEGYRHMIRFFTTGLWGEVAKRSYAYVMRLDDDSFLLSPIDYNVFGYLAEHRIEYAYRLANWERAHPIEDHVNAVAPTNPHPSF